MMIMMSINLLRRAFNSSDKSHSEYIQNIEGSHGNHILRV